MRAKRLGGSPVLSVNTLRRWRSLMASRRASSETCAGCGPRLASGIVWSASSLTGIRAGNAAGTSYRWLRRAGSVGAEVAARALTSVGHGGRLYTLTGPELLSVPDMARMLGEVLGRTVTTVDIPLEAHRERLLASGIDPAFAEVAVNGSRLVADGGNARVTTDVEQVLGRPPRTFATWARDHRAAFTH
jgi:hypothetical protein